MNAAQTGSQSTEDLIFEAARAVFYESGYDGARMQEIASRAGINHSMLHYYFRSKGKLFDAVFRKAALEAFPPVLEALMADLPLLEKLDAFVDRYLATIAANPHLPAFILQELRRNPDAIREVAGLAGRGVIVNLDAEMRRAARAGEIRAIPVAHLFANVISLCVFPVVARPMLQTVLGMPDPAYSAFLTERARVVKSFIRSALSP